MIVTGRLHANYVYRRKLQIVQWILDRAAPLADAGDLASIALEATVTTMQYRYISGDSHLEIDSKHWLDRVPVKYRDHVPRLVRQPNAGDMWMIGDKIKRPAAAADLYGGKGRVA